MLKSSLPSVVSRLQTGGANITQICNFEVKLEPADATSTLLYQPVEDRGWGSYFDYSKQYVSCSLIFKGEKEGRPLIFQYHHENPQLSIFEMIVFNYLLEPVLKTIEKKLKLNILPRGKMLTLKFFQIDFKDIRFQIFSFYPPPLKIITIWKKFKV